ncbi:MAG TPA: TonB-dependent receptor [Ohtaekwangia sp.]|uniref:TonB-dependent receptor n=1 Tax=Ohtaekwangia sp. TaxID=2066019 RepID=UPI002F941620
MIRNLPTLLILFTLQLATPAWAQRSSTRITADFSAARFDRVVAAIEEQTIYHLSFNPAWTDSLSVTLSVSNEEVASVLDKIFTNTDLHYSIYEGTIYITRERQISTELPPDYFGPGNITTKPAAAFDYTDFEQREKKIKLAEEKLYTIGTKTDNLQGKATLAGTIRDTKSGEPVIGASVYVENPMIGASTDQFGHYSLTLPKGQHILKLKSVGMKNTHRQIMLYNNGRLDIEIEEDITPLKEVVVEADRDARVTGMQMGMEKLDIKTMKQMPLALGETDIMKVVLTLPGVQTVGEGTTGLNVRGGATNQNLILYNDATVYNPSHLFGFFSTFNPDVLKNVELYKSGINAEYGGRLSSVLDVHTREGNLKKISGSGGISPITGRFTLEGPIIKDKTSFLIGARSTYSDWILDRVKTKELKNSNASFYDLNASITHKVNDDNSIYLSGYMSKDHFKLNSDTAYRYSDRNASIKWKHVFNTKLYGVLTGTYSKYEYMVTSSSNPVNAFQMNFSIKQLGAKADFNYYPSAKHTITAGASFIHYGLSPGNYQPYGSQSLVVPNTLQNEQGREGAIYIGENFEVTPNLSVYAGLRYSYYQSLGPREVYQYAPGVPRKESTIQDTVQYQSGPIATYHGAEPRFSARYLLTDNTSLKFSYNRMRQYIQMLSNTTVIAPTDIWKLSDTYIPPQIGDQWSLGFYKNLLGNMIETSVEAYYKKMHNAIDYKDGASLLMNHHIETDVLKGQGKAYGVEFMVKKATGKLNGWVSYTYSRSLLKTAGPTSTETINRGVYYPSSYDKPHAVNFIGNYKFSRRFNVSLNVVYSTGRPITLPIAKYDLGGTMRIYYSDRNAYRIPDYFRTDLSINVEGNHKIKKLAHSSWTFAVYNLTGRQNAYSVYFVSEGGRINGYKMSVFARPIPTITYNFKF